MGRKAPARTASPPIIAFRMNDSRLIAFRMNDSRPSHPGLPRLLNSKREAEGAAEGVEVVRALTRRWSTDAASILLDFAED
jgi:hypothetical protein